MNTKVVLALGLVACMLEGCATIKAEKTLSDAAKPAVQNATDIRTTALTAWREDVLNAGLKQRTLTNKAASIKKLQMLVCGSYRYEAAYAGGLALKTISGSVGELDEFAKAPDDGLGPLAKSIVEDWKRMNAARSPVPDSPAKLLEKAQKAETECNQIIATLADAKASYDSGLRVFSISPQITALTDIINVIEAVGQKVEEMERTVVLKKYIDARWPEIQAAFKVLGGADGKGNSGTLVTLAQDVRVHKVQLALKLVDLHDSLSPGSADQYQLNAPILVLVNEISAANNYPVFKDDNVVKSLYQAFTEFKSVADKGGTSIDALRSLITYAGDVDTMVQDFEKAKDELGDAY